MDKTDREELLKSLAAQIVDLRKQKLDAD